jgi:hypothetical protein
MEFKVFDIIGQRCITKEAGQRIFELIHPALLKGETVILDFGGVKQFASPFFNYAVGQLLQDIDDEDFDKLLHIDNLGQDGRLVVQRVVENAKSYHRDIDYKQVVDAILQQSVEDVL